MAIMHSVWRCQTIFRSCYLRVSNSAFSFLLIIPNEMYINWPFFLCCVLCVCVFQGARGPNGSVGEKVKEKKKAFFSLLSFLRIYCDWAVGLECCASACQAAERDGSQKLLRESRTTGDGGGGQAAVSAPLSRPPHKCLHAQSGSACLQVKCQLARQQFLYLEAVPSRESIHLIKFKE